MLINKSKNQIIKLIAKTLPFQVQYQIDLDTLEFGRQN